MAIKEDHDCKQARDYLEIAEVIIVALDRQGKVKFINRKGCELLNNKREQIIGKDWFAHFLPARTRKKTRTVFDKIMDGELSPVEYYENPIICKGGKERVIAWHNALLQDKDGKANGTLSSGSDITQSKQMQEELEERNEELEAFNRMTIGRELKMVELKQKIKELERRLREKN